MGGTSIKQSGDQAANQRVLVRFADGELLEGAVQQFDLDRPDLDLVVDDPDTNNRVAIVSLTSVKRLSLGRRVVEETVDLDGQQKVALRFRDGEVLKGLLLGGPQRCRYGVLLDIVDPLSREADVLAIPYASLKAVFYLKSWDSRPAEFVDVTGRWEDQRGDPPLVDLLGEIRRLTALRDRGRITHDEFRRRRQTLIDLM